MCLDIFIFTSNIEAAAEVKRSMVTGTIRTLVQAGLPTTLFWTKMNYRLKELKFRYKTARRREPNNFRIIFSFELTHKFVVIVVQKQKRRLITKKKKITS